MGIQKYSGFSLSLLSGLLLNFIFPRWELDLIAWVALAPLFWALTNSSTIKKSFLLGLSCGLVYFTGSCFWIINTMTHYGGLPFWISVLLLLVLTLYMALYVAIFSAFFSFCLKKAGVFQALLLSPFLWSFMEYVRTFLLSGFPWNFLGYSQYKNLLAIQIADLTGIYGVSFFVCFINAFLSFILLYFFSRKEDIRGAFLSGKNLAVFSIVTLAFVSGVLYYGQARISQYSNKKADDPLKVCLVQGNISQENKWDPAYKKEVLETYESLTMDSIKDGGDLVVWPETATPFFFNVETLKAEWVSNLAKKAGIYLLTGSPSVERDGDKNRLSNSAYFISREGPVLGRYDKIKLVPFGEYVPLANLLWFVEKMVAGIGDFQPGEEPQIMPHPKGSFGVMICFEIIFPQLARWNVQKGAQFLVNITNDAWFGRSAGPYQHLSKAVFRAVENRVPVVRAANTGISAIINQTGQIESTADIFLRGVVKGDIFPAKGVNSFYVRYGDIFSWLCGVVVLIFLFTLYRENR
jgi:apolipoprotein N-acyltransferase